MGKLRTFSKSYGHEPRKHYIGLTEAPSFPLQAPRVDEVEGTGALSHVGKVCREGCILKTNRCLNGTVHTCTGRTARSMEEKRLGYLRAVRGKTGKVVNRANQRQAREGNADHSEQKARVQKTGQKLKT